MIWSAALFSASSTMEPYQWCYRLRASHGRMKPKTIRSSLEPQSGEIKDYNIGICCFFSHHVSLRSKDKLAVRIYIYI